MMTDSQGAQNVNTLGRFSSIQYYIYSHQLYSSYRAFDLDCFTSFINYFNLFFT